MRKAYVRIAVCVVALALRCASFSDWNPGDPYKWLQMPDLRAYLGVDVNATYPLILADDFRCTETGPLLDVHIWGSWYHDILPQSETGAADPKLVKFVLSLHKDVPAGPVPFSRPGTVLWYRTYDVGDFTVRLWAQQLYEGWYTPDPFLYERYGDSKCYQYNFKIPRGEFIQQGTPYEPVVYWLDVQAFPQGVNQAVFGWKTSLTQWNDDAVWGQGSEPYTGTWHELRYPSGHDLAGQSMDMAFVITGEAYPKDWGDAPDPTYPTLALSNGASHIIVPGFMLGNLIDAEAQGQPDGTATGDDLAGVDDEDGVSGPGTPLIPGQTVTVLVVATVPLGMSAKVDGWVDWNGDGDWNDLGEQVFASVPVVNGNNTLPLTVPLNAVPGRTFARVRLSSAGGLAPTGPAADGEVEDYKVDIGAKYIQLPDLNPTGIDVKATYPKILADDWPCYEREYVTDIHVWGSWLNDVLPKDTAGNPSPSNVTFRLSIHKDVPAGAGGDYSHPGSLLWSRIFPPGSFQVRKYADNLREGWMDPPELYNPAGDTVCYEYSFFLEPGEFVQQGGGPNDPTIYWLDVQAMPMSTDAFFGWKTSLTHWMDDAVWGQGSEPYNGPWYELRYPPNHPYYPQSIDLAFAITGQPIPEPDKDWGDAPDSLLAPRYPTLSANSGANHVIVSGFMLGNLIDAETDGQPDATATGDDLAGVDDEDGVVINKPFISGQTAKITVTASIPVGMNAKLDGWIDWNADGDWADSNERIFNGQNLVAGPNTFTIAVPANITADLDTFARFRLSSAGVASYTGAAPDGEVEDYSVHIYRQPRIVNKGWAKLMPVGTRVLIEQDVVTARFADFYYFEEPDREGGPAFQYGRFAGLGVIPPPGTLIPYSPGDLITVYGETVLNQCELMLQEIWSEQVGRKPIPAPLTQTGRGSGGGQFGYQPGLTDDVGWIGYKPAYGLNSVGLLVRLWGRCTCVMPEGAIPQNFWIDDGSALWDGTWCFDQQPAKGVKVRVPDGYTGQIIRGRYYVVTGIMRTDMTPIDACVRWLWPRDAADIVLVPELPSQ